MWGQLRKGIGESVLSKIGEVVAPPPDDDDDDDDDDEYDSGSSYEKEYIDYNDDDYNNDVYEEEDDILIDDVIDDDDGYDDCNERNKKDKECIQQHEHPRDKESEEVNKEDGTEENPEDDDNQGKTVIDDYRNDNVKAETSVASLVGPVDEMVREEDSQLHREPWRDSNDSIAEEDTEIKTVDSLGIRKCESENEPEPDNDPELESEQHEKYNHEPKLVCNSLQNNLKISSRIETDHVEISNDSRTRGLIPALENIKHIEEELKNGKEVEKELRRLKELVAMKDNELMELIRAQRHVKKEMDENLSLHTEQLNCRLEELTKQVKEKDIELETNRRHFEEYKLLVEEQHRNEVEQLQSATNRAMLELNERSNEVTTLQEHLENYNDKMERRHASEVLKLEQLLSATKSDNQAKTEEIQKLKSTVDELRQAVKVKQNELDEVDNEADELHQLVEDLEGSNGKLKERVAQLENDSKEALGLHIEMQLLKEERDREALKASTLQESKESNQAALTAELNAARAEVLDLQQRLAALQADLDVAKADKDRAITASSNLQRAMEAFESEREAELEILEESRKSAEEAMLAAHELALQALKKDNDRIIEEMQVASNKAIKNMMDEIKDMERKQEEYIRDNVNLRRSLDEAIQRLHSKEEDVIDRSFMRNILLDWHSKSGKSKREVLAIMSSVLHFTQEDKEKCGLIDSQHTISKVVGTLAPPLHPAVKSPEELDGDNIREKWVNFLLAECGESPGRTKSSDKQKRNHISTEGTAI